MLILADSPMGGTKQNYRASANGSERAIACMHLDLDDDRDEWTDEPVKIIRFITGGWSGAEDLIGVMLGHFWIKHFHKEWKRGGLFVFEVPERFYAARPASPKESDG